MASKLLEACKKTCKNTYDYEIDADGALANKIQAAEAVKNSNRMTSPRSILYCSSVDTPEMFISRYRNALQFSSKPSAGHFVAPQRREPSKKLRPS